MCWNIRKLKLPFISMFLVICLFIGTTSDVYAATKIYYGDYGIVGGIMCHSTRVKYTYDTVSGKTVNKSKGKWTTVATYTCSKTKKKGQSYSLSRSETTTLSTSINATIPLDILKSVVPDKVSSLIGNGIGVGVTKSKSESVTCSGSGTLYNKGDIAKLQVRYITKTQVRTLICQKQVQATSGKWENSGSTYKKKITIINKYPDHRIKEVTK